MAIKYFAERELISKSEAERTIKLLHEDQEKGLRSASKHMKYVKKALKEYKDLRTASINEIDRELKNISIYASMKDDYIAMLLRDHLTDVVGGEYRPSIHEMFWEQLDPDLRKALRSALRNIDGVALLKNVLYNIRNPEILELVQSIKHDKRALYKLTKILGIVREDAAKKLVTASQKTSPLQIIENVYETYIKAIKKYKNPINPHVRNAVENHINKIHQESSRIAR